MDLQSYIDEIKLELSGGVLELEIPDETIATIIKKCLRELERYWDEVRYVKVPFASCIDLTGTDFADGTNTITHVYRTEGYSASDNGFGMNDPMYAQQWMVFSNAATMYNLNDYLLNYAAWSTLKQIKNTLSTDLAFIHDKHDNKLYINEYMNKPSYITIEYIPKLKCVEDVFEEYWIDILLRLSTAMTKIILGRIRTRYTQTNALWTMDGQTMLEEGNTELKELREVLRANSNMQYNVD